MHAGRSIEAVAVGASSGGIDALTLLLQALPPSFVPALLLVMHIPASNEGLLVEVLAPHCALPVREAFDKDSVVPGTVYVAPPGYHLLVEPARTLALSVDEPVNFCRPSIDVLFESAAYAYREALLGIVLTGANEDGARGLDAIRRAGGLAWVQQPSTSVSPVMPESALRYAGADRILALSEMATELARFVRP
ncbi:MAG: chemotaxis protein CheB [Burkholderiales bacterium]|nr:chemotaxis protein CheB [Burkholderiales bacterium]